MAEGPAFAQELEFRLQHRMGLPCDLLGCSYSDDLGDASTRVVPVVYLVAGSSMNFVGSRICVEPLA